MSQTSRILTQAVVMAILNSRATLNASHVGQQVLLAIQGSGTFVSAAQQEEQSPGHERYFDKYIYNLKANSQEAMGRPENRKLLASAVKAESAGNEQEASDLFNDYLNAVQISFNVIADRGYRFQDGDMVTAIVGQTTTKSGHNAIVVDNVRYKAPVAVEKTKFDLTALLDIEDELEEEEETPAPPAKPAGKPKKVNA